MKRKQRISIPDHARRDFLKWTIGVGASLGLRPWKVFEAGESLIGPAFAEQAACSPVNRFVGNVMGNGGFAWMTQLWPFRDQALQAGRAFYATGQGREQPVAEGDHPMWLGPDAPDFGGRKMTAFVCGDNEAHTPKPTSVLKLDTGVSLFAAVAATQTASPTLVPAIAIGDLPYGLANGAPMLSSVASSSGMVELFNSAAASPGGPLAGAHDAALFEAYYKAHLELRRAAALPTMAKGFRTAKSASALLGKNLASQLRPTDADFQRYGIDSQTQPKLLEIATTLISTVKSFKLNLTSSVLLPGTNDDPHPAFADLPNSLQTITGLGKIWSAFMGDLAAEDDPLCAGAKLADNTVIAWTGDTGKDPFEPSGWPDGTPQGANWMYVLGAGMLRGGWFGDVRSDGTIQTWNPRTGANVGGGDPTDLAGAAGGAVLYAIAKGDLRRVQDFYRGELTGIIKPKQS
jgi:hypothetical protein